MRTLLGNVLLVLSLPLAGAAGAQGVVPGSGSMAEAPSGASARQHQLYRTSRIVGTSVRDLNDRRIGRIQDLVLDGRRGEVTYAVVSFGGVLGVGQKLHAVPWQVLQPENGGRHYTLNVDRETINLAPAFDKANWPDMTDAKWRMEIERYWSRKVGRGNPPATLPETGEGVAPVPVPPGPNASGTR